MPLKRTAILFMAIATATLIIAAQPTPLQAQTNQGTTAAQNAEKNAQQKAAEQKKKKKQKAENKKKKNEKITNNKKEEQKETKKQNQNQNVTKTQDKKKNKTVDEQNKQKKQQATKEQNGKKAQTSAEQRRAERQHRAQQAKKQKGHDVWYSDRRVVHYRGRDQYVRSRRVLVVNSRYRNRYHNGLSVYYLPPAGAAIVASAYIISAALARPDDIYDALYAPPVVHVKRRYSMNEVVEDPQVRQMVRSVDMDINFASGSSDIPDGELPEVNAVAHAMKRVLKQHPHATFLVEGHTDATGDPEDNLLLSEDRAAAVVAVLEGQYGISHDNLEAVGYGEQYLKEDTKGPSEVNRRVVVRNISGVLKNN